MQRLRIWVPSPTAILNQTRAPLGIPFRFNQISSRSNNAGLRRGTVRPHQFQAIRSTNWHSGAAGERGLAIQSDIGGSSRSWPMGAARPTSSPRSEACSFQERASYKRFEERNLVSIFPQRRSIAHSSARSSAGDDFIYTVSHQHSLGRSRPMWHRRCRSQDNGGACAVTMRGKIEHYGNIGERPIENISLPLLHIGHPDIGCQRRQATLAELLPYGRVCAACGGIRSLSESVATQPHPSSYNAPALNRWLSSSLK